MGEAIRDEAAMAAAKSQGGCKIGKGFKEPFVFDLS